MPGKKQKLCDCLIRFGKTPLYPASDEWKGHCVRCGGKI